MKDSGFTVRAAIIALAAAIAVATPAIPQGWAAADRPLLAQAAGDDKAEIAFWESIKDSKSPAEYKAYLDTYPKGKFAALARVRMDALNKQAAPAAAPKAAPAASSSSTSSSSSSNLPQLPGQSGGASGAQPQPAAAQPAAAAAPVKEEPKIEYWTASRPRVNIYKEPNGRSSFVFDDYYVIEQGIKVVETIPGKKVLPWLKVITPKGATGYVFSGEARPAGVSASGKQIRAANMDD